jgi:glycosyltransferase involved in cell wall biosynthesis
VIARFEAELGRTQAGQAKLSEEVRTLSRAADNLRLDSRLMALEELSAELKSSLLGSSQNYDNLLSEYAEIVRKFNEITDAFSVSNLRTQYLLNRSILEKLFFRVDGRPVRGLRRLLFHKSGKPRKLFRILVLQKNGKPRRAFSYWMTSQERDNTTPRSPPADRLPPRLGPTQSDGEFLITGGELLYGRGLTPPEIVIWQDVIKESPEKRNDFAVDMINQHINQTLMPETQDQVRNDPSTCQIMGTSRILTRQVWDERCKLLSATNNDDNCPLQGRRTIGQCSFEHTGSYKVSMIASLYKGGLFIRPFLENITSLSLFDSAELIIIDANSPDQEHVIIKEYEERFPNIVYRRINYRIGIYEAWNLGVEIARGHYLTNTNLDDLRRHDSIAVQAALLDKNDDVDVVYQDFYYSLNPHFTFEKIAAYGFKSELPIITPHNLLVFNSPHNAPMWRASLHNDVGKFDTRYRSAGDYEFWVRCLANGKTFRKINTPHVVYYHNPEGISTQPDTRGIEEAQDILRRYSGKLISPALLKSRRDFWASLGTKPPGAMIADNTPYYDVVQSALLRLGASRSATDASRS